MDEQMRDFLEDAVLCQICSTHISESKHTCARAREMSRLHCASRRTGDGVAAIVETHARLAHRANLIANINIAAQQLCQSTQVLQRRCPRSRPPGRPPPAQECSVAEPCVQRRCSYWRCRRAVRSGSTGELQLGTPGSKRRNFAACVALLRLAAGSSHFSMHPPSAFVPCA